jgi:hypothetical protein
VTADGGGVVGPEEDDIYSLYAVDLEFKLESVSTNSGDCWYF